MKGSWQEDRPASPHKLLNAYIKQLAKFTPLDGNEMIMNEEVNVEVMVETFQWERIQKRKSYYSVG